MRVKIIFCFLFFAGVYSSFAQLVLNNGVIVFVANGSSNTTSSTIVLNSQLANPIKQVGVITSQGIVLESEWNRVQLNLSTSTTPTITVPYISKTTGTYVPFPLTMSVTAAGANNGVFAPRKGSVLFSSTKTAGLLGAGYLNSSYMPFRVADVGDGNGCPGADNSANVIDRFWVIQPVRYTTRPAVIFDFTYIMDEACGNGGNTALLYTTLQPQRNDTTIASAACPWNGFPSTAAEQGTNAPFGGGCSFGNNVGTLKGVTVSAANFFPDWTLANYLIPLPVEITNYNGVCENKNVTLKWISASETNSAYYTIEKSFDGTTFSQLTNVLAAGNSLQSISYTYIDVSPGENATTYYRLSETDKNGAKKVFKTISVAGCSTSQTENGTIYSFNNEVNINFYSLSNQNVSITAYDVTGRLIYQNQFFVSEGNNSLKLNPNLAQGVYVFELKTEKISVVKRILIEN